MREGSAVIFFFWLSLTIRAVLQRAEKDTVVQEKKQKGSIDLKWCEECLKKHGNGSKYFWLQY